MPRVVEAFAVRRPGQVAARGAGVDVRDDFEHLAASVGGKNVYVARLRAAHRQRHRHELAVRRCNIPVDRRAARRIEFVRIDDDALAVEAVERIKHD